MLGGPDGPDAMFGAPDGITVTVAVGCERFEATTGLGDRWPRAGRLIA